MLSMSDLYQTEYGDVTLDTGDISTDVWFSDPAPAFGTGGFFGAPVTFGGDGFNFADELTGNPFAGSAQALPTLSAPAESSWWSGVRDAAAGIFTRENLQTTVAVVRGVGDIVQTVRRLDDPPAPAPVPRPAPGSPPRVTANPNGTYTVTNASGASQVVTAEQLRAMQSSGSGLGAGALLAAGAAALFLLR